MNTTQDRILLEDRGSYALMRINRADKRNAMDTAARQALRGHLQALRQTHKVIVITGSGDAFCSGMDLKEFGDDRLAREAAAREWIEVLLEIRKHPAVIIAAVNGFALGGGTSLINVSDLAIAADEARIGMPEMGFGVYPAMAGPSTQMMLPAKRAAWLVLTAKRLDGPTAEAWGLVNQSVPVAELDGALDALARHVAQFDAAALTGAKRALDMVPRQIASWREALDFGQQVNAQIRAHSTVQSQGLANFRGGHANPGQGKNA